MVKIVTYDDGSTSTFGEPGTTHSGSGPTGGQVMKRIRLLTYMNVLKFKIEHGGEITRNGVRSAMRNMEQLTGEDYRLGKTVKMPKGRYSVESYLSAYSDAYYMVLDIEGNTTVTESE